MVTLVPDMAESAPRTPSASTTTTLLDDLHGGDRIVIGDGAITLGSNGSRPTGAECQVRSGGHTQGRPGVHLPSERLRIQSPTPEDLSLAAAMAAEGADFLAVSFVRDADDLDKVRDAVAPLPTRLVAKIETLSAIEHLDEIIAASDAVMVARGDLGIECPLEDVPHMQKQIVRICVEAGIPVITATQMLESMITAPSPTRAEVSDVANAVFDGTDALMLSAETAIGVDPVNVVSTMAQDRGASREGCRLCPLGRPPWARCSERASPKVPTGSPWPSHTRRAWPRIRRRRRRHPLLHAFGAHRAGNGQVPSGGPADRPVTGPCDGAGARAVVGCRLPAGRDLHDHRSSWCGTRSNRQCTHGLVQHRARSCWCWPARPIVPAALRPTCCGSSASVRPCCGRRRPGTRSTLSWS